MKRLLGLLLVIGMVGCGETPTLPALVETDDGVFVHKDENGKKSLEVTFKDGRQETTEFYENGQKASEFAFNEKTGEPEGLWTEWYENGQKMSEQTYKNGRLVSVTQWHENGQKSSEATWKDGMPVSETKWDKEGNKIKEPQAKVDEPPVQTADGSKLVEIDGLFYEINSETPFTGAAVSKDENGQKASEGTIKDGKAEGLQTWWHENGQKQAEYTFKDGKLEGLMTQWHKNGQKSSEATWKDGMPVSETKWDEEGNEIK